MIDAPGRLTDRRRIFRKPLEKEFANFFAIVGGVESGESGLRAGERVDRLVGDELMDGCSGQ